MVSRVGGHYQLHPSSPDSVLILIRPEEFLNFILFSWTKTGPLLFNKHLLKTHPPHSFILLQNCKYLLFCAEVWRKIWGKTSWFWYIKKMELRQVSCQLPVWIGPYRPFRATISEIPASDNLTFLDRHSAGPARSKAMGSLCSYLTLKILLLWLLKVMDFSWKFFRVLNIKPSILTDF